MSIVSNPTVAAAFPPGFRVPASGHTGPPGKSNFIDLPRSEQARRLRLECSRLAGLADDDEFLRRLKNAEKWAEKITSDANGSDNALQDTAHGIVVKSMAEVRERRVEWLWRGILPLGKLSLLASRPGMGKTLLICDISARLSRGLELPCGAIFEPCNVLLLSREDDPADTLKPRLRWAGADMNRIFCSELRGDTDGSAISISMQIARVRALVESTKARFVVVDTAAAFADAGTDERNGNDARALLGPLDALARELGICVLVISHVRKTPAGGNVADAEDADAIIGSVQWTGGVRAAALMTWGQNKGERWIRSVKCNAGPMDARGWTWTLEAADGHEPPDGCDEDDFPVRIVWHRVEEEQATSLAAARSGRAPRVSPEETQNAVRGIIMLSGPQTKTRLEEQLFQKLIGKVSGVTRADCRRAVSEFVASEPNGFSFSERKNAKLVGLAGNFPSAPAAIALQLALEDPEQSVRDLAEKAGCRMAAASKALNQAREKGGK